MNINIDLSEQDQYFLKQIHSDYLFQQDNNQTHYPNWYVLVDYNEIIVDPDFTSEFELFYCDPNYSEYEIPEDKLEDYLKGKYSERYKEYMIENDEFDWDWSEDVEELISEFEIYKAHKSYKTEDVQTFLSRKAAETFLRENSHHYHQKAFIDRRKPWSDEMKTLVNLLYKIGEQVTLK